MAEHPALETRLRAALGAAADGAAPRAPSPDAALPGAAFSGGPPTDPDVARARVLSGIRHRRARRLRVAGGAVTAVAALGIALPLVLGGGPAPTGAHSPESSSALAPRQASASPAQGSPLPPAAVPGAHARSTPASTGRCLAGTATPTPCGDLAAGTATGTATGTAAGQPGATSATPPEYRAAAPATRATVHVRAGRLFEITLPRLTGRRTWSTPRLLGTYHGQGTPLEVRRSPRTRVPRPGWQGFVVRTTVAGTFELEAYAQAPRTPGLPPTAGPLATWTLKVEVTGK